MSVIVIPGKPIAHPRMTRGTLHSKRAKRYYAYKDLIGYSAKPRFPHGPLSGELQLAICIYLKEPAKRRWDIDNVTKSILDGLNHIAYEDDKQVVSLIVDIYPTKTEDRVVVIIQ